MARLIFETMETFVTVVCLVLMLGGSAHRLYSTIDKTSNTLQWGTNFVGCICVVFEICQQKEMIGESLILWGNTVVMLGGKIHTFHQSGLLLVDPSCQTFHWGSLCT